ncbi:Cof-type HAD-IIB family hydrolase [Phenylobacterium montanum]|uniref:HAD family hydrolase n=1 Tax=Phenylobacterium montanum TaxID=2823693 RepID=A0A975FZX4_9CAUL|nr:Cof-type HAD-IIB family hydrolase [Caulobacter sp. S6]QUD88251.1 HAD family hydrolase [Caulobacter sp. S6]
MAEARTDGIGLIATDLDGTLLRSDGTISERTRAAIRAAEAAGVPFVFVTGRPPRTMRAVAAEAGLTGLAICANGAILYDLAEEAVRRHDKLEADLAIALIEELRQAAPGLVFATEHGHALGYEPGFPEIFSDAMRHHPTRVDLVHRLCDADVTKLIAHHPEHDGDSLTALAEAVVGLRAFVTHSGGPYVEIGAAGVSKGSGVAALCEALGVRREAVAAFGDMPNDLPLLAFAGLGVAVANAHPQVLAAADEVTASNDEDGVARVIERLLGG